MPKRLLARTCVVLWSAMVSEPVIAHADPGTGDSARPTFAGSWTLNRERSDESGEKMKEAMDERPRGGRGPRGGSGGGGPLGGGPSGGGPMAGGPTGVPMGGPGKMGATPDPQEMERQRAALDEALRPSESLLVSQEGVAFEITHEGDRIERLYADGRKNKNVAGVERKTRWVADKLVTEAKLGGGFGPLVKITETWALAEAVPASALGEPAGPSSKRLCVTTRLEGGPFEKPLVLKRLYDRAPAP